MVSLFAALQHIFPGLTMRGAGLVDEGDGPRIRGWDAALGPQPSPEQIQTAMAELEIIQQKGATRTQARQAARVIFAGLSTADRAKFGGRFVAAIGFLDMGDWAAGIQIIEDQPVPAELEPVKAAILDKLREGLAQP